MSETSTPESGSLLPWLPGVGPQDLPATLLVEPEPGEPVEVSGTNARGWVPRPEVDVASSWLRQITVMRSGQQLLRLQASLDEPAFAGVRGDQHRQRPEIQWPLSGELLIIGAVRGPTATFDQEATWSRDELTRQLVTYGIQALPAITLDRRHEWTEPSVIALPGAPQEQPHPDWQVMALDISRRLGIRTVVRITEGTWEVLTLSDPPSPRFEIVASAACSLTRDDERRCPMQLAPSVGEYCHMRGGPWTSSSIHAAAGWRDQRNRLVAAIGCDTCEGTRHQFQGKILSSGGPITIAHTPAPTRWLAPDWSRLDTKG
jgi:hypothetical protein